MTQIEKELAELKAKYVNLALRFERASNALVGISIWNDTLEQEWGTPKDRADYALEAIKELRSQYK